MNKLKIVVVAYHGISPFLLSIPCEIFSEPLTKPDLRQFDLLVCSIEEDPIRTRTGFLLHTPHTLAELEDADIIIIPAWRNPNEIPPLALLDSLRRAEQRGALLVALCLGAYVLAAAGILDGRAATTHWMMAEHFAQQYPQVRSNFNVLYVEDGKLLTSAGSAAGIDCCLHLLRQLQGSEAANRLARLMVVPPHRQGGQAQFIEQPIRPAVKNDHFSSLLDWLIAHLDQPHSLDNMAERACMSRRNFTRQFCKTTGTTPTKWLLDQRLLLARQLLESGDLQIETIAEKTGFATPLSLRQHFKRAFGISPSTYRKEFGN